MTLFVDGEPLDVDKLNDLWDKINKVQSDLKLLTTRYNSNNKVIDNIFSIIETGSQKVQTAEGKSIPIQIPRNAFLNTDPNPSIQVTIGDATESVNFSISEITKTNFKITFHSKSKQSVVVYWMAVVERKIS
jgi:hypothetical protein